MSHSELTIPKNSLKAWVHAARPKTLAPAFAPIFTATLLAYFNHFPVTWELSLFALLAALCIQIGTNYINDSLDSAKKRDTAMRLGPVRMTQAGLLPRNQVYAAGIVCFCLGLLFGMPLMIIGGYPLLLALVASVAAGYLYTGGPYPLGYHGWGKSL